LKNTWGNTALIEKMYKLDIKEVEKIYKTIPKCIKDLFVQFRGDLSIGIAVKDNLMKEKGFFPYRIENPYRVFRYAEIIPITPKEYKKEISDLNTKQAKEFLIDLKERKNYILGFAEINWRTKPRKYVYLKNLLVSPQNLQKKMCYSICDRKDCIFWQFLIANTRDSRVKSLENIVNDNLSNRKLPFIVFNPSSYKLPHIFYHYPIHNGNGLCVAFGENALLVDSLGDT
ncbi:MAG: hypothetical protein ACE5J3_06020, partial [Methanosarcinales archaeon]